MLKVLKQLATISRRFNHIALLLYRGCWEKVYEKIRAREYTIRYQEKFVFWSLEIGSQYKLGESRASFTKMKLTIARSWYFQSGRKH
jgi:hypothetical protein